MTTTITTLTNGMRVVTDTMPHLETASLGVWIGRGTRSETEENNGVAHFLEHMAFKGTKTRSAREIAEEIENVGGDLNAATSLDTTAYYARVLKADVKLGIEILGDILLNSVFDREEIKRERDVILQEIAATNDVPEEVVHDEALALSFPDQAIGRPILGTEESVATIARKTLLAYLKENYTPANMVLSAAGGINHAEVVAYAEEIFAGLSATPPTEITPARYAGGARSIDRDCEQAQVVLSFESPSVLDPDYMTAQVLSGLLGGGMSSRLFQEAREKRGLCYSIYSYVFACADCGIFGIHAGTRSEQVGELRDVVVAELVDLATNGPTPSEVQRAKAQLKAGLAMALESSGARAEQMARHLLTHGRVYAIDELVARVEGVGGADIQALVARLIRGKEPTWAQLGDDLPPHDQAALVSALTTKRKKRRRVPA